MMFGCANLVIKNIKSEMDAIDLVIRAYQGIRNFHVSALYGGGLAEIRLGKALKILKKDYG